MRKKMEVEVESQGIKELAAELRETAKAALEAASAVDKVKESTERVTETKKRSSTAAKKQPAAKKETAEEIYSAEEARRVAEEILEQHKKRQAAQKRGPAASASSSSKSTSSTTKSATKAAKEAKEAEEQIWSKEDLRALAAEGQRQRRVAAQRRQQQRASEQENRAMAGFELMWTKATDASIARKEKEQRRADREAEREQKRSEREADKAFRYAARDLKAASGPQYGPGQILARAEREMARAEKSDDPRRIFDAKIALKRAQESMNRANLELQGSGMWNRAAQAMAALRVRIGGGGGGGAGGGAGVNALMGGSGGMLVMPFASGIARLATGAGAGGVAAGAIAVAIGAAIIGLKVFSEELGVATGLVRAFTSAGTLSGGSAGDIAGLTSIGIGAGNIPGMAQSLRERLSRDPFSIYTAASLGGGYRMPRPFGSTNEAGDLMDLLSNLREVEDAEVQLRMARMLGLETSLELIRVSDKVWKAMENDIKIREKILDDKTMTAARDLAAEIGRVGAGFENLRMAAMKAVIPVVASDLHSFANALQAVAMVTNNINSSPFGQGAVNMTREGVLMAFPFLAPLLKLGEAMSAQDENTKALNDNTKAHNDTAYLLRMGFSTPEAAARVRRFIPESMFDNPIGVRKWLESQSRQAGSYNF